DLRDERTGALDRAGPSLPRSLRAAQGGSLQSSPVGGSQSGQLPRAALGVPLGGTQAHEGLVHGSRGERAVETDRRTGGSRANREGQRQAGNDGCVGRTANTHWGLMLIVGGSTLPQLAGGLLESLGGRASAHAGQAAVRAREGRFPAV